MNFHVSFFAPITIASIISRDQNCQSKSKHNIYNKRSNSQYLERIIELKCKLADSEGYSTGWTRIDISSKPSKAATMARGINLDVPSDRLQTSFDQQQPQYSLKIQSGECE